MDIAPSSLHDRLAALETENLELRSRLQACEQSYAVLQAEVSELRRREQQLQYTGASTHSVNRTKEKTVASDVLKRSLDLLATDPDPDKFVGYVLTAIAQQFHSPLTEYWSQDDHTAYIELVYWEGHILDRTAIAQRFPCHVGLEGFKVPPEMIGSVPLRQRKNPIFYEDHSTNPFTKELAWVTQELVPRGLIKEVNVPLFLGETTIGALTIHLHRDDQFTFEQVELAQALSHQVTLAVEMRQLSAEVKQAAIAREREWAAYNRAAELAKANESLQRSLNQLASDRNLESFLAQVIQEAIQVLDGEAAQLFLYDASTHTIAPSLGIDERGFTRPEPGVVGGLPIGEPFPADITIAWERIRAQGKPAFYDIDRDQEIFWPGTVDWHRSRGEQGVMAMALVMGEQPLGLLGLTFTNRTEFTEAEFALFQALAQQATLAIQLAHLGEEAKQAAFSRMNEILARKQERAAQERVNELAKANDALKQSLNAIATDADPQQMISHILKIIAEQFEAPLVEYWSHTEQCRTAHLNLTYWQGNFLIPAQQPGHPGTAAFPCFPCLIHNQAVKHPLYFLIEDITTDPNIHRASQQIGIDVAAWFCQRGVSRLLNIPLWLNEKTIGALDIWFPSDRYFTQSQIELAYTFGQQVTLATYLNQLFEETKQTVLFEERNRIAGDIHDTLAQTFTGISLQLEVAKPLVYQEPNTVDQILHHISQLTKNGLAEARRSVWELYPPGEEYANLAQMLYDSVEQMSRNTPISLEVAILGNPCPLPPYIGMNLLRIGQEALTNALKHSQAQTVWIELTYTPDLVLLSICDNGCGFTPPTNLDHLNGGFGLVGMYERCDRIGAQLSILSHPGRGTQISVESPLG